MRGQQQIRVRQDSNVSRLGSKFFSNELRGFAGHYYGEASQVVARSYQVCRALTTPTTIVTFITITTIKLNLSLTTKKNLQLQSKLLYRITLRKRQTDSYNRLIIISE